MLYQKSKDIYLIKKAFYLVKEKIRFPRKTSKGAVVVFCLFNMRSKTRLDLSLGKTQIEPTIANILTNCTFRSQIKKQERIALQLQLGEENEPAKLTSNYQNMIIT